MKWRNSKERELLASGGSRDQTLPNKNNPNPDLSDAKTDRAPSLSPPSSPGSLMEQQGNNQRPSNAHHAPSTNKNALEQKFLALNKKFDLMSSPPSSKSSSMSAEFKYELDDINRSAQPPAIGQLFNNFYDNQSSDGSVKTFSNQNGSANNMYYDEYDSNSDDSDEEINVT